MNTPAWPEADLVELHQMHLTLLKTTQPAHRSQLVNQIVRHDAFILRFKMACGVVMKHHAEDSDLLEVVQQETNALLIERFLYRKLAYRDEGQDAFGGWIYQVCLTAFIDSFNECAPKSLQSTVLVGDRALAQYEAPPETEHNLDKMRWGIDTITESPLREIMLEAAQPERVTLCESARIHNVSISTVFRLREKGIKYLQRYFQDELSGAR